MKFAYCLKSVLKKRFCLSRFWDEILLRNYVFKGVLRDLKRF